MVDNYEVTNNEIMDFLKENMVMKEELNEVKEELRREIGKLKLDMGDMMDEKLADLKGDMILFMRKDNKKLLHLVSIMKRKNLLTDDEVRELITMEPFPQIVL